MKIKAIPATKQFNDLDCIAMLPFLCNVYSGFSAKHTLAVYHRRRVFYLIRLWKNSPRSRKSVSPPATALLSRNMVVVESLWGIVGL